VFSCSSLLALLFGIGAVAISSAGKL